MSITGLYLHIPFCRKICPFCSFAVSPDRFNNHEPYLELLKGEIAPVNSQITLDFSKLQSVYLGGGTPSRLNINELSDLILFVKDLSGTGHEREISIEVNPEDMTCEYAQGLKLLGFNRISLGVQSFKQDSLTTLGRVHTQKDNIKALEALQKAGFNNFNVDLIFGFPGQSLQGWMDDIQSVLQWKPTHLSLYCLNIEPKTIIYRKNPWKIWQGENEGLMAEMYIKAIEMVEENGIMQYEVSNFARLGFESRQNQINWSGQNFLGLGQGAHSFVRPYRWGNFKRRVDYQKKLRQDQPAWEFMEKLSDNQLRDEELMIQLRLKKGINILKLNEKYPSSLNSDFIRRQNLLLEKGLLLKENQILRLTKKGLLMADEITVFLASCWQ